LATSFFVLKNPDWLLAFLFLKDPDWLLADINNEKFENVEVAPTRAPWW
jgi:hypothetical protein